MAELFANGFEEGNYSAWTAALSTGGGATTLAVAPSAALVGSQGSRSSYNTAGDNGYEAKASKTFSPPTTARLFAQTALRLTSVSAVGYSAAGSKAVLAVRAQDGQEQAWFSIRTGGVRFSYRSKSGAIVAVNSSIALSAGTIAHLRIMVDRAGVNPVIQGWISGNGTDWMDIGNATDVSLGSQGVGKASGQIEVGIIHISNFEPGSYTIDHDGILVQDSLGATDWQVLSNLVQPVRFNSMTNVDRQGVTATVSRLSTSSQGTRNALSAPEWHIAMRSALSCLREALTVASEPLTMLEATNILVNRLADTKTAYALIYEMAGNKDWQQASELEWSLRTKHHAVMGEIEPPVTVRVSDRAWGEVSLMDSEA